MEHENSFDAHTSIPYQTSPPATVVMAGNHKEDSPMRIDDLCFHNTNLDSDSTALDNIKMSTNSLLPGNGPSRGDLKLLNDGAPTIMQNGTDLESEAHLVPATRPASNVIVDDSPLQNQMEKNKECK